jgi:hypothetical protein
MAIYTYTIFDANPNSSSGTEWPTHDDIQIEADSDEEVTAEVRDVMSVEAAGLNTSDGYEVGDVLHALVWDADGTIVGTPTYELTAEDLGVEEPVDHEERLARAAKHVDATDLGDGLWAHYADETSRWYVVTAEELEELCDYLDDEDEQISGDAYSHWCAGTSAKEMPAGWEPDDLADSVIVETMPEHHRAAHRAAGNWGAYPHNGATRQIMRREAAEELVADDSDEYTRVVRDADADDLANYEVVT